MQVTGENLTQATSTTSSST